MKKPQLTRLQQESLNQIKVIQQAQVARLQRDYPGCTPSMWVFVDTLVSIYKLKPRDIKALINKGYLISKPSDGFGTQVLIATDSHDYLFS